MILSLYFNHFRDICIFSCIVLKICKLPHVTITSLASYDQWQSGKLAKSGPFKTISWDAGLLELSGVKSSPLQCLMDAWYGICLCPQCTLAPWYERKANYQISPRCLIPPLIALIIALHPPPSSPYQHIHTSQHAQHYPGHTWQCPAIVQGSNNRFVITIVSPGAEHVNSSPAPSYPMSKCWFYVI